MKGLKSVTNYLITLLLLVCLSSCLTPRKVDRWIEKKYGTDATTKPRKNDYLVINEVKGSGERTATTQKRKMKILPLLFYWKWEYGTHSTLNQAIPAATIKSTLPGYANSKGLKQKLNGQTIELTIDKTPAQFSLIDKGWLVFVLVYYITADDIFMQPDHQDLVVSYRLLKDNAETKTGTITVADRNKDIHVKYMQSVKKTFWNYLDIYNSNIQLMTKELVDKLAAEI